MSTSAQGISSYIDS